MTHQVLRELGRRLKKCLLTAALLATFCLPAGAARKGTFGFGIQAGSSLGFKPEFGLITMDEAYFPHPLKYGSRLYHHLGVHIQYNIFERFGLRFDLAFQDGTYTRIHYDTHARQWEDMTEGSSFIHYTLNGVYCFPEWKNTEFFLLAGAGNGQGDDWIHGPDGFVVFTVGAGANIYLVRNSGWALSPGVQFHHLYDPTSDYRSSNIHGSWISFTIGVEYAPRVRPPRFIKNGR